jgi:hypothetical protein
MLLRGRLWAGPHSPFFSRASTQGKRPTSKMVVPPELTRALALAPAAAAAAPRVVTSRVVASLRALHAAAEPPAGEMPSLGDLARALARRGDLQHELDASLGRGGFVALSRAVTSKPLTDRLSLEQLLRRVMDSPALLLDREAALACEDAQRKRARTDADERRSLRGAFIERDGGDRGSGGGLFGGLNGVLGGGGVFLASLRRFQQLLSGLPDYSHLARAAAAPAPARPPPVSHALLAADLECARAAEAAEVAAAEAAKAAARATCALLAGRLHACLASDDLVGGGWGGGVSFFALLAACDAHTCPLTPIGVSSRPCSAP